MLDAIAETAGRLCNSDYTGVFRLIDGKYHIAASDKVHAEFTSYLRDHPSPFTRDSSVGRAALERQPIQIPDVLADPEYKMSDNQRIGNIRTALSVPLVRDGIAVAVLSLIRMKVHPFTEKEIQIVRTFANQALIAIVN